ncbi:hypothetical protein CRUP_015333, partial [Coryphaenoides rupestris]
EAKGDYTSDDNTRADLKKLPVLPTKLVGLSRGQAIVRYLTLVESLPTYGVHYYEVKDKQGMPWWLGISYKGIGQYDLQDKLKPRKLYQWKQLENLYFREKKFAVEVNDPHRRAVTKRTFGQTGLLIHTWYASHSLIKTIWVMAISQHQFYLDRKQSKVSNRNPAACFRGKIGSARSLEEIAMDLTEHGGSKISRLGDAALKNNHIMASNGSLVSTGSADSEASEEQKREKISELRRKEQEIQDVLAKKTKELKKICLREAELTGKLPQEYPLSAGERPPQIRRRVGTAFQLDDLFPYNEDPYLRNLESRFALQRKIVEAAKKLANEAEICKTELTGKLPQEYPLSAGERPPQIRRRVGTAFQLDDLFPYNEDPYLRNLESRFALERKIVEAAKKLANEAEICKTVKKKRRRNCLDAMHKLQQVEDEMNQYRVKTGKKPTQRASLIIADELVRSDFSSLSSLPLDDGLPAAQPPALAGRRLRRGQTGTEGQPPPPQEEPQQHYPAGPREPSPSSGGGSPYKTLPRPAARDPRSTPPTPVMTRNAYSSSQLSTWRWSAQKHSWEVWGGSTPSFRHRSGSLESEPRKDGEAGAEGDAPAGKPVFTLSPAHRNRSCSSEALEDCSSYASQSSLDYCLSASAAAGAPPNYCTLDSHRTGPHPQHRLHRRVEVYGNSGSMPNLVPHHHHSAAAAVAGAAATPTSPRRTTTAAAAAAGTRAGPDAEPYANGGAYVFESEVEGHYNVNPSYQAVNGYNGCHERAPRHELLAKSMPEGPLVAEHLRGWFHQQRGPEGAGRGLDYDRRLAQPWSLGYPDAGRPP